MPFVSMKIRSISYWMKPSHYNVLSINEESGLTSNVTRNVNCVLNWRSDWSVFFVFRYNIHEYYACKRNINIMYTQAKTQTQTHAHINYNGDNSWEIPPSNWRRERNKIVKMLNLSSESFLIQCYCLFCHNLKITI